MSAPRVAVVALGKIGLPIAVALASRGFRVYGSDVSPDVVSSVNRGHIPNYREADLSNRLRHVVKSGALSATTSVREAVARSDVVVVVVPLIVDREGQPELDAIEQVTDDIGEGLTPNTLVSYETTLPVGTTRRMADRLSRVSGLELGSELFVVHSPERVLTGRVFADLSRYPKIVGGVDDQSTQVGANLYSSFITPEVWAMDGAEGAELAKLAETTYRDLNIAFANELAIASRAHSIDIGEVIEACNSQPYSRIHRPGISVGGHCIPVYPQLLMHSVGHLRLPAIAREINSEMPLWVVRQLADIVGGLDGLVVGVLGVAYRGGVKEHAFSGVFALVQGLESEGASTRVSDPLYSIDEIEALGLTPWLPGQDVDAVVVHTDHKEYAELCAADLGNPPVVYDGRNVLDPDRWTGVHRLGGL